MMHLITGDVVVINEQYGNGCTEWCRVCRERIGSIGVITEHQRGAGGGALCKVRDGTGFSAPFSYLRRFLTLLGDVR